jgi:hypothetical protein
VIVKVRSIGLIQALLGQGEMDLALASGTTIDGLLAPLGEEASFVGTSLGRRDLAKVSRIAGTTVGT